jgi:glycerophosphoryl diester phosphodiesterase
MNTNHLLFQSFAVFGHRGAAGLAPENTLPSFQKALQLGCRGIELDVHRVTDHQEQIQLCVIHDAKVDRTTKTRGRVADFTVEELSAMDAGGGYGVPLLTDVITLLDSSPETWLNIELKGHGTAAPTARLLCERPNLRVLVSSFDHKELAEFRALAPKCPVAPLFHRHRASILDTAKALSATCINVGKSMVSEDFVTACQQAGYPVMVYTVNEPEQAQQLKHWGVAGIFSDRPDLMMLLQT